VVRRLLVVTTLIVWTGATSIAALRPQTSPAPTAKTSVWDGIYTHAQAERGKSLYLEYCVSCHRDDLGGFSTVPPLAGEVFLNSWAGRAADDLYTYIRSGMPPYQSTAINRQAYLDILAFIFQTNAMPEGGDELKPDSPQLKATITKRDAR
jgi:mono/diheme cytochrome c family protein